MPSLPLNFAMAAEVSDADALSACAASTDPMVRGGAAANRHTDPAVLRVLGHDADPLVALLARIHPAHPRIDAQKLQELLEQARPQLDPERVDQVQAAVERAISRAGGG